MGLNPNSDEVDILAKEAALQTHETRSKGNRRSLAERRECLLTGSRRLPLMQFLEQQVWPHIPADVLGTTLTREKEDLILGYGPNGY